MNSWQEFVHHIQKEISDEMIKITQSIIKGTITSFEEYKYHTGKIEGLNQALATIQTAISKLNEARK